MKFYIILFETDRNEKPLEEFIKKQQSGAQAKIIHSIELLENYGSSLGMPHSKLLGNKLYELRIRGKEEIRIIYCFAGKDIYLLHAFKKQTQKTPEKELKIALMRFKVLK